VVEDGEDQGFTLSVCACEVDDSRIGGVPIRRAGLGQGEGQREEERGPPGKKGSERELGQVERDWAAKERKRGGETGQGERSPEKKGWFFILFQKICFIFDFKTGFENNL
jgi:hypothetical protein